MRLRSLRARLLLGVAVLVACGLTAGAVVTYAEQRSFLMDRVDQQVDAAAAPLSFELGVRERPGAQAIVRGALSGDAATIAGAKNAIADVFPYATAGEKIRSC